MAVGTTAASLQVLISDTTALATASSDWMSNGNQLNIHSIRGTTGAENGWTPIISAHGTLLTSALSEEKAASARDQQARAARENVSGVDLDVEAAELLRMQQNYSGCAKIIQVARETFQRSEEHTSELQSLMRISYAVFCLKKNSKATTRSTTRQNRQTHAHRTE